MKKSIAKLLVGGGAMLVPFLALSQTGEIDASEGLGRALYSVIDFINSAILPFVFAIAVLVLIWGIFQFVTSGGDEEKRKKGRDTIVWGVIFLFVMLAIVGLVNLLVKTFDFNDRAIEAPFIPVVPR